MGRGQFGTVSTATDKATGEVVAVKRVPRSRTTEKNFREEAEVHREVGSHPNVVGLKVRGWRFDVFCLPVQRMLSCTGIGCVYVRTMRAV